MGHIIMGIITLILLIFHLLKNWDEYRGKFGDTGVKVLATFVCLAGPVVYPLSLAALALMFLFKVKGNPATPWPGPK